jgi:hypothetical protein
MQKLGKGKCIILKRQGQRSGACLRWQGWLWALLDFVPGPALRPRTVAHHQLSVPSFQHERKATVRKIYTMIQMQDLINDFLFN